MLPFVKQGGQVRRVESFEIVTTASSPLNMQQGGVHDPATNSALRTGEWYKIEISKSGIFKLDKTFFQQNNIPTNFDPRTLKIYGNGGKMLNENPGDFRYGALQENAIEIGRAHV